MHNLPEIQTQRLLLRNITENDVSEVFDLRSDPELMKYIPRPLCKNHEDALKYIRMVLQGNAKGESINWGIARLSDNFLIGIGGFVRRKEEHNRAEIGYIIRKEEHGKGYMKEAIAPMIEYGFNTLKLNTIEAIIDPENIASENLLLAFGFVKEAHFRDNVFYEGRYMDSVHYTLFKNKQYTKAIL